jgi:F-type H+-transporting ATPase subunit b
MEETLHQLGGILLRAIPTFIIVVLLHFYLKFVFFKPLQKVLRRRYEATEGARKLAGASLLKASEKAAEYEAALRSARADTYKELEQLRRQLQDDRAAGVKEARARAEAALTQAKSALAAEVVGLKKDLEAETGALADRIAGKLLRGRAA